MSRRSKSFLSFIKYTPLPLQVFIFVFNLSIQAVRGYDDQDFVSPLLGGGRMLIDTKNGFGEPLNVIISGKSSPEVLTDSGIVYWARSLGFSYECLGQHGGAVFSADLGDGNGFIHTQHELRQMYSNAEIGTCLETFVGGNHFRSYRQNGPNARTNALFLAVSHEEDLDAHHDISPNGYDMGRDELVARATNKTTEFAGITYSAISEDITGLLYPGSEFINHDISIDGIVKMLTVRIIEVDEDGKEWLDTIMAEEGLPTGPSHREARLIYKLPNPEIAPNQHVEPESGPESLLSEWRVEHGIMLETTTTRLITSSTQTTTSSGPRYTKQGDAKILGFSST